MKPASGKPASGFAIILPLAVASGLFVDWRSAVALQAGDARESNLVYDARETAPAKTRLRELSATAPEHWDVAAVRQGLPDHAELRFATFGGENSRLVAIAVDPAAETLWIDRNRDRRWSDDERVAATHPHDWRTTLPAEFVTGVNRYYPVDLTVQLEWDPMNRTLRLGTVGAMRGVTELADQQLEIVRTDENSNGRWLDPEDRVWIDFNRDGRFDLFNERFAVQAILVRGGQRFVVAADEMGELFSLNDQIAMGFLAVKFDLEDAAATIDAAEVDLVSREGVPVHLDAVDREFEVPAADYRVTRVYCSVNSGASTYTFHFARDATKLPEWISVRVGESTGFDPLGELTLSAGRNVQRDATAAIAIQPWLGTATGLYLSASKVGTLFPNEQNSAAVTSYVNRKRFDVANSGFL